MIVLDRYYLLHLATDAPLLLDSYIQQRFGNGKSRRNLNALLADLQFIKDSLPEQAARAQWQVLNFWLDIISRRLQVSPQLHKVLWQVKVYGKTSLTASRRVGLRPQGQARHFLGAK